MFFGKDNSELKNAPFLVRTIEKEENEIKFIVALTTYGEKGSETVDTGNKVLNDLLQESVPLNPDYDNMYEIIFEDYVFHITRNESYASYDEWEIRKGKYFIIFERSHLLELLPEIVVPGFIECHYPDGWKHYGIYCQNHIIDVIAPGKPIVKKYTPNNV